MTMLNRRDFMKRLGMAGALGTILTHSDGSAQAAPSDHPSLTREELAAARKKARTRKRRMIMNNDGNDFRHRKPDEPNTPEHFLGKRTTPLVGSHVDAVFYCTGVFNLYSHKSEESELYPDAVFVKKPGDPPGTETDSLEVMTAFGHEHGMEVFWSMRMNDTHDSSPKRTLCKWKQEHPEYLVGKLGVKLPYGCNRWSSVDYGVPEVRDKVFRVFEDVCTRYDVDGIEMDFFRHPVLFRPQMTGEPVTQEHRDLLTALVRRIRTMTEEVGTKRGRPVLVAMRGFDSIGYSKALGIDLVRWLEEDLVDIVTCGGYFKFEPWGNLAALGKQYDVPVYACFASRRLMDGGEPEAGTALKIWRGEALRAWKAGVDGIYTFNRFNPKDRLFRELGDPALLATLERVDQESYVANMWSRPERWLRGGDAFVKVPK